MDMACMIVTGMVFSIQLIQIDYSAMIPIACYVMTKRNPVAGSSQKR